MRPHERRLVILSVTEELPGEHHPGRVLDQGRPRLKNVKRRSEQHERHDNQNLGEAPFSGLALGRPRQRKRNDRINEEHRRPDQRSDRVIEYEEEIGDEETEIAAPSRGGRRMINVANVGKSGNKAACVAL